MLESIIKKRKSIRHFDDRQVDINLIKQLLDIARYSPSGKNRQPWKIKILSGSEKEQLIELLRAKPVPDSFTGSLQISINAIEQSSRTLLFFNPYSYQDNNYTRNTLLMDIQSLGAFIQNFLLLLTEKGISSLWINDIYYARDEIEDLFDRGELEVIAAVALGYSSEIKKYDIRNELKDILL